MGAQLDGAVGGEWRKGWGRGIGFVYYNVVWGRRQRGKAMICYLAYSGKYININFILKIPFSYRK